MSPKVPRPARAALLASLLALGAASAALANGFPAQSLIIPTQSAYQDPCGMVSAYGLVYQVLRANDGLIKDPTQATSVWQTPVTIHWVYNGSKKSPNRCVPTGAITSGGVSSSVDLVYSGGTIVTPNAGITDTTWNDGCDMRLDNVAGPPASLVNNSNTASSSDTAIVTYDTTQSSGSNKWQLLAFPNFKSKTVKVDHTGNPNADVTSVQYAGGAFVINSGDAPAFLGLLQGTITAKDVNGTAIDFSAFKSNGGVGCAFGATGSRAVFWRCPSRQ